jgi:hypothetical protein
MYKNHLDILPNYVQTHPINRVYVYNPNYNPIFELQMLVYLELMEVRDRENGRGVFLWLVCNIKISVTALYVMRKC